MNTPYVKEYNSDGVVTNPIQGSYVTEFPQMNRKARRDGKQKKRFRGNGKNYPLSVLSSSKYVRLIQWAWNRNLERWNRIEHYQLVK